jgi:hypothetical protein
MDLSIFYFILIDRNVKKPISEIMAWKNKITVYKP